MLDRRLRPFLSSDVFTGIAGITRSTMEQMILHYANKYSAKNQRSTLN